MSTLSLIPLISVSLGLMSICNSVIWDLSFLFVLSYLLAVGFLKFFIQSIYYLSYGWFVKIFFYFVGCLIP